MSVVKNLECRWDDFQISIPRWEISDTGVTALVGPSGSGKSSVFRILLGLHPVSEMSWEFKGIDLARLPVQDRNLGVVFQTLELFPHLTAFENIMFALKARYSRRSSLTKKVPTEEEAKAQVERLVQMLRLDRCSQTLASRLSGGEKQRVALARAVVVPPRMLLLDEPFSALDQTLRSEARELVKELVSQLSLPTLLITHDPQDVKELAQFQVQIENGRLV